MERKTLGLLFVLLLVLAADDLVGVKRAEAFGKRACRKASMTYKGPCVSDGNCARVCKSEGYNGGDCHGLRRRCMCSTC